VADGAAPSATVSVAVVTRKLNRHALGVAGSVKLWNAVGKAISEGTFKDGGGVPAPMTPEDAGSKIKQLQADPDWRKAYLAGDQTKQLEYQTLLAIQSGDDSGLKTLKSRMGVR